VSPESKTRRIVVEHAYKVYGTSDDRVHALDDVNIEVADGEFVCIVGPSGCGKSTLLWSISGLMPLTQGRILLGGEEIRKPRDEIGLVFQDANLLPWRTLMENIKFPLEIKRLPIAQYEERIEAWLREVGLTGFQDRYPGELSGGMQQRASIVRCLTFDPSVVLMDEPFAALDALTREDMNQLIQQLWMETGKTIIFVTHNIDEAVFLADRVILLSARPGRVAREFSIELPRPRDIDMRYDPEVAKLLGEIKRSMEGGGQERHLGRPGPRERRIVN
jgi:NitT/TauT family transport system ATP-binding protein